MRKIIPILFVWISYSCANNMSKESIADDEDSIMFEYELESKNLTLEELASEKLVSYFELLKLKNRHPEFQEGILEQLKDFSDEEFVKIDSSDNFVIENIRKVGKVVVLSDSVQKMIFRFDLHSENLIKTDSVEALIKTKTILLDDVPTKSTKITFFPIEEN